MKIEVLSAGDAADRLGVKHSTIRKWVREGKMKATKLPGALGFRIRLSEIERLEREWYGEDESPS